ncbi:hypothetical protein ACFE04_013965 [Oxalis oulophora]
MEETLIQNPSNSPPQQQQPDPKKLKMSTTTSDDDDTTTTTKTPRYKRRKVAIFFAYCGVGYQGMQKNPGAKTIEGDLEEALFLAGGVPESDRNNPRKYDWARSARTDKGVSAVGQVVSGRFYVDPPGFIDRLNANLPGQIRMFGFKRVTNSFNAKKFCDRRRYVYLIPVFALDPASHPSRESVAASLGSGNELVKCLDCSERGRKVVGAMGRRWYEEKRGIVAKVEDDIVIEEGVTVSVEIGDGKNKEEVPLLDAVVVDKNGVIAQTKEETEITENDCTNPQPITDSVITTEEGKVNGDHEPLTESKFSYGDKEKEKFNRILNYYIGSHNYHNFTTRTHAEDPAARRNIISFHANTIVTVHGIDFVKCEIVGQSFMLHQIRKMMGLAVSIMRDVAPESLIETALRKDVKINVPTAPEVGLYLDECFFTSYNNKWKDHEEVSMKAYEEEAEEFKMKHIYSHIGSTEKKEGTVGIWLHSLNHRNYPDLGNHGESPKENNTQVENPTGEPPKENNAQVENPTGERPQDNNTQFENPTDEPRKENSTQVQNTTAEPAKENGTKVENLIEELSKENSAQIENTTE